MFYKWIGHFLRKIWQYNQIENMEFDLKFVVIIWWAAYINRALGKLCKRKSPWNLEIHFANGNLWVFKEFFA